VRFALEDWKNIYEKVPDTVWGARRYRASIFSGSRRVAETTVSRGSPMARSFMGLAYFTRTAGTRKMPYADSSAIININSLKNIIK
jgi:hypothetical protein